jgi:hypothetical protein
VTVQEKADALQIACLAFAFVSAAALVLLRNPDSFLSRLVDRPDGENTTDRKALR